MTSFAVDFSSYSLMENNQLILQINSLVVICFPNPINRYLKKKKNQMSSTSLVRLSTWIRRCLQSAVSLRSLFEYS